MKNTEKSFTAKPVTHIFILSDKKSTLLNLAQ